MKSIFRKWMSGLLLIATAGLGGCSDDPDGINDELVLDRALMPLNVMGSVLTTGNQIRLTWDVRTTDTYEVVVYSDEGLTQKVTTRSDIQPTDLPVTLDLEVEKEYYATVQAFSSNERTAPSKVAIVGPMTTYAIMSPLNPVVTARTSESVTLTWDQDDFVSHLLATPVAATAEEPVRLDLSEDQIAQAEATISGLKPSTEYFITVCYNSAVRGGQDVWTRPDTEGASEAATAEELLRLVTDGATRILLTNTETPYDVTPPSEPAGSTNALSTALTQDLAIYGQTSTEGKKPTVIGLAAKLGVGTAAYSFHLEDLVLNGNGGGSVVAIESANVKIENLTVKNCEVYNYTKGVIAETLDQADNGIDVQKMTFDGLYMHDIAGDGGDAIDFRFGTYHEVSVVNSTFYNGGRGFLFMQRGTIPGKVTVSNNTISNFSLATNRKGLICLRATGLTTENFTVSNNLILNEYLASKDFSFISNYSDAVVPTLSANYFFNYYDNADKKEGFFYASNLDLTPELILVNGSKVLSEDPCEASERGKFYLVNGEIASVRVGDPRWWNAVAPVIPEQTELNAITEATVWNFADPETFEAQTIDRNRILGNLQFLVNDAEAPMAITGNGTISFSAASTFSPVDEPTNNALAFKVSVPGSVLITPSDAGYNKHMELIVNGSRYALPADGSQSKFGFGDIQGETMIYICSCSPVELEALEWSLEVVSGGEPKVLETPVFTTTELPSLDQGTSQAVTVSWNAVPNAAAYEVTFNGKTQTVETPTYEISASTVAALKAGNYTVTVVAKAAEGSLNWTDSQAASLPLKINEVLTTILTNHTWDFSDAEVFPAGDIKETTVYGNLQFLVTDPAKPMTIEHSVGSSGEPVNRIKFNGKSTLSGVTPSARALALRVNGNGTLTLKAISSSGSDPDREVGVSANGKEYLKEACPTSSSGEPKTVTFTDLTGETMIYIYCYNTINIYALSWEPDPSTVPSTKEYTMTLTGTAGVLSTNISGLPTSWKEEDSTWTATDDSGASTITFTGNVYYSTDAAKNIVWYFNKGKAETHVAGSGMGKIKSITVYPNSTRDPAMLKCTYDGTTLAAVEPAGEKSETITFDFAAAGVATDNFRIDYTDKSTNVEVGKVVIVYEK
ncbi:hypothetical protein B5E60_09930 [Alistipes sp. An116]|uniref:DUF4957 domain-containing protein n=1 Tax=Alistipes sp. An116 TaxID=1965546 RepID=UPI000B36E800|nr:DUF4957 domain-containing protein [Alistipes sp. An116]OUQ52891.1 hypothetical protein B5E60_09930 [Alistipes sp. An116]